MRRSKLFAPIVVLLLAAGLATAQSMTPADTEIVNQASATFLDSAGLERSTTSNQVITIVQQVYALSLTPDNEAEGTPGQTKYALPGGVVYFNYVLTNEGNGTDAITLTSADGSSDDTDFASSAPYWDENCNGVRDTGEGSAASISLSASTDACILVQAVLSGSATSGDAANLNLTALSAGGPTDNSWATGTAETAASFEVSLSRTPAGTVDGSDTIEYTFIGTNIGGAASYGVDLGTYISALDGTHDVTGLAANANAIVLVSYIPDDTYLNYDGGAEISGTAGSGTVSFIYATSADGTNFVWEDAAFPADETSAQNVRMVAMVITGTADFFPVTAELEFSFTVDVDPSQNAGSSAAISNFGTLGYSANDTDAVSIDSNVVYNSQDSAASYGFSLATYSAANYTFMDWNVLVNNTADQDIATAETGDLVRFAFKLQNTNTSTDTYALSIDSMRIVDDADNELALTTSNGWSCQLRHYDGVTPLPSLVGPLVAGETFDFSLACLIGPSAVVPGTGDGDLAGAGEVVEIDVEAVSSALGAGGAATVLNSILAVTDGYDLELQSDTDDAALVFIPADASVVPGETFYVPLEVHNLGSHADVYDLSSSLPSGWSVVIHHDNGSNGIANRPTTQTDLIAASGSQEFVAAVTVPATQAPGSQNLTFTATSTSDGGSDTLSGSVTVEAGAAALTLDPDRAGTVTAPGTITYQVNLRNNRNSTLTTNISASASGHSWTYQLSKDGGTTWESSLTGISTGVGAQTSILVRVIVPGGQPVGRVDNVVLTASGTFGTGGTASDTAALTTTVVGGDLHLQKWVATTTCAEADGDASHIGPDDCTTPTDGDYGAQSTAEPGEYLFYKLVATNIGNADITEVIILEPLPGYTEFVFVEAETTVAGAEVLFSRNGTSWHEDGDDDYVYAGTHTDFSTTSIGNALYVGLNTDDVNTNSVTGADVLGPAETITIYFVVKVK